MARTAIKTAEPTSSFSTPRTSPNGLPSLRVQSGDSYPPTIVHQYGGNREDDLEPEPTKGSSSVGVISRPVVGALVIPSILTEAGGDLDAPTVAFDARELIAQARALSLAPEEARATASQEPETHPASHEQPVERPYVASEATAAPLVILAEAPPEAAALPKAQEPVVAAQPKREMASSRALAGLAFLVAIVMLSLAVLGVRVSMAPASPLAASGQPAR